MWLLEWNLINRVGASFDFCEDQRLNKVYFWTMYGSYLKLNNMQAKLYQMVGNLSRILV